MSTPWLPEIDERIRAGRLPNPTELTHLAYQRMPSLGDVGAQELVRDLADALTGLGPLESLASEVDISDILVNPDGQVWVDRGTGVRRHDAARFPNASAVRDFAVRLAATAGRRLDDSQPWVDGVLPGGVRLHAILPPLASDGPHISLRLARRQRPTLRQLQSASMVTAAQADALRELIEQRRSFVITGGTGSGKTTLLAALLALVAPHERVVVVEDVSELAIEHPHVVRLQSRAANVEGAGAVGLVQLVRQALRMRPDRLVVGEVRGAEVRELLQALNTGHEGGCGTLHANRIADVPARCEALGALAGLSSDAVRVQLRTAVHTVIHVQRRGSLRQVVEVAPLASVMTE